MEELTEEYVLELISELSEDNKQKTKEAILTESGKPSMIFSTFLYQDDEQLIQLSSATGGGLAKVTRQRKNENNNVVKDQLKVKIEKVLDELQE